MIIETTIILQEKSFSIIKNSAEQLGTSKSHLIVKLLRKIIHCEINPIIISKTVKYQRKDTNILRKTIHLYLNQTDYEKALDLRKFMKKSLSFLITEGIEKYLTEILNELKNNTGNNKFIENEGYFVRSKFSKGFSSYKIFWGCPEELIVLPDNYRDKIKDINEFNLVLKNLIPEK